MKEPSNEELGAEILRLIKTCPDKKLLSQILDATAKNLASKEVNVVCIALHDNIPGVSHFAEAIKENIEVFVKLKKKIEELENEDED